MENGSHSANGSHLGEWVTVYKHESHSWNLSHLKLIVTTGQNGSLFAKWVKLSHLKLLVTLNKMGHFRPNGSNVRELVTLYKHWSHSSKLSALELWVRLCKVGQTWENESHFINRGHTHKIVALEVWVTNLKEWVTLYKDGSHSSKLSHLKVWVTLGKMGDMRPMGHTWENESVYKHESHSWNLPHLKLLVTLGKMGHFWPNGSNLEE